MSDFDPNLAAIYGICVVCGSHRQAHRIIETHPNGSTTDITRLVCARDFTHDVEPVGIDRTYPPEDAQA